jgi:RHS repeat-associated protein
MRLYLVSLLAVLIGISTCEALEREKWVYEFDGTNYDSLSSAEAAMRASEDYTFDYELTKSHMETGNSKNIIRHYHKPDKNAVEAGSAFFGSPGYWGADSIEGWVAATDGPDSCPGTFDLLSGPTSEIWRTRNLDFTGLVLDEGVVFTAQEYVINSERFIIDENSATGCRHTTTTNNVMLFKIFPKVCPDGYFIKSPQPLCTPSGDFKIKKIISKKTKYCTRTEGNPCSPITGHKTETYTDYKSSNLNFIRSYSSSNEMTLLGHSNQPLLGNGWTHNYAASLRAGQYLISEKGNVYNILDNSEIDSPAFTKIEETPEYYIISKRNGSKLRFNRTGFKNANSELLLDAIIDQSGNETVISYEEVGTARYRVESITGPFGHQLLLKYDNTGRIEELIIPSGDTINYSYELAVPESFSSSVLAEVSYPDQTSTQYHYENPQFPNALTGISISGERYGTYIYDDRGRVIESGHVDGANKIQIEYNEDGTSTVTYADGSVKDYLINEGINGAQDKPYRIVQGGKTTQLNWEADGQRRLIQEISPSGVTTEYEYDIKHLVRKTEIYETTVIDSGDGNECGIECEECGVECEEFPSEPCEINCDEGNLTRTVTKERVTEYGYSDESVSPSLVTYESVSENSAHRKTITTSFDPSHGKPLERTTKGYTFDGDEISRTVNLTYNSNGDLISIDGARDSVEDVTEYTYYECQTGQECGNLQSLTNALGHTVTYDSYDENGRLLKQSDGNGLVTEWSYRNFDGRISKLTQSFDAVRREKSFEYYDNGLLKSITSETGSSMTYEYDGARRVKKSVDGIGNSTHFEYDLRGNITSVKYIDVNGVESFENSYDFDEFNRLIQTINGNEITTEYTYDNSDNTTLVESDLLSVNSDYDALGRLVKSTDQLDTESYFENDINDSISKVLDSKGLDTIYKYDDFGNVLYQESPDTGIEIFEYDNANNLIKKTDARGIVFEYSYDALNRLISKKNGNPLETVTYTYDDTSNGNMGIGRLTQVEDQSGLTTYSYNAFGQIVKEKKEVNGVSIIIEYIYADNGLLTKIIYPSGRELIYNYNANDQISEISTMENGLENSLAKSIQYLPFGPVLSWEHGNGEVVTNEFDKAYRLTTKNSGSVLSSQYSYDTRDNILEITDSIDPVASKSYTYDDTSRLMTSDSNDGLVTFQYDEVGNRISKDSVSGLDEYHYSTDSHHLLSVSGANSTDFIYDESGRLLSKGNTQFAYNNDGRLMSVSKPDMEAQYQYNYKGERVLKQVNDEVTILNYNMLGQLVAELNQEGTVLKQYFYLNGQPLAMEVLGNEVSSNLVEITYDDTDATLVGDWKDSTSISGFLNEGYLYHVPNAPSSNGVILDNTDATLSGDWQSSTAIEGYWGSDYVYHEANMPASGTIFDSESTDTSIVGDWKSSTSVSGYNQNNYLAGAQGTGEKQVTWSFGSIESTEYKVYARWTAHSNRASNATYQVMHAVGSDNVIVNQRTDGAKWNLIGQYSLNSGSSISINNDADGWVIADAILIVPVDAEPNMATWNWQADQTDTMLIYGRWSSHSNRATDATYQVSTSSGFNEIVEANQSQNGGQWNLLATIDINQGESLSVSLSDQANGYVIADSIQIVSSSDLLANTATWNLDSADSGEYEVFARWTAHSNRATNATYTINNSIEVKSINMDQTVNGGSWQSIGTYQLNSESIITLSDRANGYVIADGIRIIPTGNSGQGNSIYFYHNSHIGTPEVMTDQEQNIVWQARYTAFGKATLLTEIIESNLRFSGQYYDSESKLHYNHFRYYDSEIGRYIQSDPIGLNGGINTYVYAYQNPIKYTDPKGLLVPFAHRWVVREAAKELGCSASYADNLADLVAGVDSLPGSQDPHNSEAHHMADGSINQTQEEAAQDYADYINELVGALDTSTDPEWRNQVLAMFIHAEQDGLSWGHENFQQWNGFNVDPETIAHGFRDLFVGKERTEQLIERTKQLITQYGECECEE